MRERQWIDWFLVTLDRYILGRYREVFLGSLFLEVDENAKATYSSVNDKVRSECATATSFFNAIRLVFREK